MYMTSADLRNKLLSDPQFTHQLYEDTGWNIVDDNTNMPDETKINSDLNILNTYFSKIEQLQQGNPNHPRLPLYIRVPFGEPEFTIDTNTRVISVPSDFTRNGVGVVGDHLAEILFFKLPRFFDVMDLYACDTYIYWRNTAYRGENARDHVQRPVARYADGDDLYFGWVLSKDLSVAAGTIEFGVEFVHRTSGEADFRLVTQPARLSIKAALEFENSDELESNPEDYEDLIFTRDIYSNIINSLTAAAPIITQDLDPDNNIFGDDGTGTEIDMFIAAESPDGGSIIYRWLWNNVAIHQPGGENINDETTGAECYELIEEKNIQFTNEAENNTYQSLTTNVPGTYVVYVGNQQNGEGGVEGIRYIYSKSVVIDHASDIEIDKSQTAAYVYLDGDTTFTVSVTGNNGHMQYDWHRIDPDKTPGADDYDVIMATTSEPTINLHEHPDLIGKSDAELRGAWYVDAKNQLNNTQTHAKTDMDLTVYEMAPVKLDKQDVQLINNYDDTYTLEITHPQYNGQWFRAYAEITAFIRKDNAVTNKIYKVEDTKFFRESEQVTFDVNTVALPEGTDYDIDVYVTPIANYEHKEFTRYPMTVVDGRSTIDYTRVSKRHDDEF